MERTLMTKKMIITLLLKIFNKDLINSEDEVVCVNSWSYVHLKERNKLVVQTH